MDTFCGFSAYTNSKTWLYFIGLFAFVWMQQVEAAKKCPIMNVQGAKFNAVDGLYDFTPDKCNGRRVYLRRDPFNYTTGNERIYMYFHFNSLFSVGWTVGPVKCSSALPDMYLYVWNLNQRPDRNFRAWLEVNQDDKYFRYNRSFKVRCTEGMSYGALMGIVLACVLGAPILIIIAILVAGKAKRRKQQAASRRRVIERRNETRQNLNGSQLQNNGHSRMFHQVDNRSFQPDDMPPPSLFVIDPPSYQDALTDQSRMMSLNFSRTPDADGVLPPPYEEMPPMEDGTYASIDETEITEGPNERRPSTSSSTESAKSSDSSANVDL